MVYGTAAVLIAFSGWLAGWLCLYVSSIVGTSNQHFKLQSIPRNAELTFLLANTGQWSILNKERGTWTVFYFPL
jgi:hypothetical protein